MHIKLSCGHGKITSSNKVFKEDKRRIKKAFRELHIMKIHFKAIKKSFKATKKKRNTKKASNSKANEIISQTKLNLKEIVKS